MTAVTSTSDVRGKWVVVRSDRLFFSIDRPNTPYIIGRNRSLPAAQQIAGKYASRDHIALLWQPQSNLLFVTQLGKNPTFYGPECYSVPRATPPASPPSSTDASSPPLSTLLAFRAAHQGTAATLSGDEASGRTVAIPPCDPLTVTQAPDRTAQPDLRTLFFPDEVGLPSFVVRYQREPVAQDTAATTHLSVQQMLAVPHVLGEEEEDDDGGTSARGVPTHPHAEGSASMLAAEVTLTKTEPSPQWRGLLDVVMQQEQQQAATLPRVGEATDVSAAPRNSEAPSAKTAAMSVPGTLTCDSALSLAASTTTPTVAATSSAIATPPTHTAAVPAASLPPSSRGEQTGARGVAGAAPTASVDAAKMGLWEWKCRANGKDSDPRSWRRYPRVVAELLEGAYRAKKASIAVPDSLLHGDSSSPPAGSNAGAAPLCTYSVCFGEASLHGGMIQYQTNDPARFRVVRRTGGDHVDRREVKPIHVIPASSSSSDDSESSDASSLSSEEESVSSSSTTSSESTHQRRKKHRVH